MSDEQYRFRNICLTEFKLDKPYLWEQHPKIEFMTGQLEMCPTTKKKHFQLYIEFNKQLSRPQIVDIVGTSWFRARKGTQEQAIAYCNKIESRASPAEMILFGNPSEQGRRCDIERLHEAVLNGLPIMDVVRENPQGLRIVNNLLRMQQFITPKWRPVETRLMVHDEIKDFCKLNDSIFHYDGAWDGYDAQTTVVMWCDTPKHQETFWQCLKQGTPCRVPTRQGPRVCNVTLLIEVTAVPTGPVTEVASLGVRSSFDIHKNDCECFVCDCERNNW